jgi:hypothetical protein
MPDTHAASELKLYIDNDGELYRRQTTSILKNLATKRARGQYKHDLAVKAFGYLAEAGAKKYAREFGAPDQPWHKMFDAGTRKQAAEALARDFEVEARLGNYDHLLPKKYQKQEKSLVHHARKKLQWKTPESIKVVWSPVSQAYLALWPGRGRIEDQQVLKIADADEMHAWLRDTYGAAHGLAHRASPRIHHATISARDIREFRGFLRNATDSQVQGIYEKENRAGRDEYAELAVAEAERRGIALDEGRLDHARKKSAKQLNREIAAALGSRRHS